MRYTKITCALLCLVASNSFALELMTNSENKALKQIESQYNIDSQLISANDRLSLYNKRVRDHSGIAGDIANKKSQYDSAISTLPQKILAKSNVAEAYKEIEKLVNDIEALENNQKQEELALKQEYKEIQADYKAIGERRTEKSKELASLKNQISKRLIADLSKSKSSYNINLDGDLSCSKFQSIFDCMRDAETQIVSNTVAKDPFLNDRSVLLDYDVKNASMDMRGKLNYSVSMRFKPSYNKKIDLLLNEKLGFKTAMVTLVSNVKAEWFVDGMKVGEGKKLSHEISLGKHGILASYNSEDKSSVEVVESNAVFNYNFKPGLATTKDGENVGAAPVAQKKVTAKAKKAEPKKTAETKTKPKLALFTDKTIRRMKDVELEKKVIKDGDKSFEYFMGLEPASKEQEEAFLNKK
ncbi:hypothetical protein [Shewanella gelidii]|uniref:Uncharacterized protein n=1 Tax=Shewanella gelidii TaxID=1642821 RepID=A0A917JT54_9GAMM|nr:hypothetical protein [Shewanella gelidii]MCL1097585.1 hypothetical protein [Shewanella gelidii]GGI80417.1 hypothetical protein GCM10009332_17220 [Shewanella gelidii]